jgi:glycosyltransferase involved in cell wall biosynthesis
MDVDSSAAQETLGVTCFIAPDLPLVSIGVPVYNGGQHLRSTLNCLLEQDYPRLEVLIADNGSTDDTAEIATEFARIYPFMHYYRHAENIGAPANFMSLVHKANGKYFMWASTHDRWSSGIISRAVDAMEADKTIVLSYAVPYWITTAGEEIPIETTLVDTRTSSKVTRFVVLLWGLTACPHFYGVHRIDVLKRMKPFRKMFGPDNLLLAELACKGSFAVLAGEKFYMRQLGDFNDWCSYFRKLHITLSAKSHNELYWEFINTHLKLVIEEFPNWKERLPLLGIVLFCMFTKYRWVPQTIKDAHDKQPCVSPSVSAGVLADLSPAVRTR